MKKLIAGVLSAVSLVAFTSVPTVSAFASEVKVKKTVAPEYPRGAERRNIEGYVVVKYTVTTTGDVSDVTVVESSPAGIFDDAALQAVNKWKFETPAQNVPDLQTKVSFKL